MRMQEPTDGRSSADVGGSETPMPPLPANWRSLARAVVTQARKRPRARAVSDSLGTDLTYRDLFLRASILARGLGRPLGAQPYVGLLLPPSAAAATANLALALLGKIPININYSAGQQHVDSVVRQCEIEHMITSRKAAERLQIAPKCNVIYLEELSDKIGFGIKLWALAVTHIVPTSGLGAFLPGLKNDSLDDTATILFTSGTTGDPKGVVLSNRNLLSNIRQIEVHLEPSPNEAVLGVLPFFHAMGFTVTLCTVLCLGRRAVYHPNPLDARIIGGLCRKQAVTLIFTTPTFMRAYIKRCKPEDFATVQSAGLGAEKLPAELARELKERFQIEPLEGFGATELSPVVSFNVAHDVVLSDGRRVPGNRIGSVGRPLPGTAVKMIDPETRQELPRGAEGLLCVKGPQVMVGYFNRPDATAQVIHDGWYVSDDLARLDDDGFLIIAGRLSRFSKIGGEMVPHEELETRLRAITGTDDRAIAVTSVGDARRGERLAVLYHDLGGKSPADVVQALRQSGLPNLWLPSANDFAHVEAIPVLGTGKLDLRKLRELAQQHLGDKPD